MADEQAVVPDAQADDDIELAAGAIEQFRLRHRVAHRLEISRPDLLFLLQADVLFRHAAVLARHRSHLQAVTLQNGAEHPGEIDEADAHGDTHFAKTHFLRKLANLLHPSPFAVAFALDHGRSVGDAHGERVEVRLPGGGDPVGVHLGRTESGTAFVPFSLAAGAHRARAIGAARGFVAVDVFAHAGFSVWRLARRIARRVHKRFAIAQYISEFTALRAGIQRARARPMRPRGDKFCVNRGRAWV